MEAREEGAACHFCLTPSLRRHSSLSSQVPKPEIQAFGVTYRINPFASKLLGAKPRLIAHQN